MKKAPPPVSCAHENRLFSSEIGNVSGYRRTSLSIWSKVNIPSALPLWPAFFDHSELKRGHGFCHKNYTRFAFEMPLEGNLIGCQRNREELVSPGQVYLIHYGEDSSFRVGPANYCRKISFGFSGSLVPALMAETGLIEHLSLTLRDPDRIFRLAAELERKMCQAEQDDVTELSTSAYRLIMELALSIDKEIPPQLTRCIDIMKVNLSQMITIGEIAEKLECSTSTLEELFKRHFHTTPRKYFDELKYNKAKQLLASTALPLSEIARSIGYRHTMHFSRAFRNRVGMTPTEFRKKKSE